jgi:hypothetical protein
MGILTKRYGTFTTTGCRNLDAIESGQPMDIDMTSDQRDNNRTHPSREEGDGSWVATQFLHNDEGTHAETRSLLDADADDVDEADPNLATLTQMMSTKQLATLTLPSTYVSS